MSRTPTPDPPQSHYLPVPMGYPPFQQGYDYNPGINNPNNFGANYYNHPSMQRNQYPRYASNTALIFPPSIPPEERRCQPPVSDTTETTTTNEQQSDNSNGGKSTSTRWSDDQALVLVQEWKERIDDLESNKNNDTWKKVIDAVNNAGPPRTMKQCKDKLRNLKQAYKEAKANNKETGREKKTSPYYDLFDEVLGSRPVVTMPGVLQSLDSGSSGSPSNDSTSQQDSDDDSDDNTEPTKGNKRKSSPNQQSSSAKKKVRKGKTTIQDAFANLTEKMLEIQSAQMEAMEKSQSRAEELMLKLEMEQRKLDEESRRRDQEFFLRMAQLLKN